MTIQDHMRRAGDVTFAQVFRDSNGEYFTFYKLLKLKDHGSFQNHDHLV
jgi:hypothetical protein